jgi:hypothetical protein
MCAVRRQLEVGFGPYALGATTRQPGGLGTDEMP